MVELEGTTSSTYFYAAIFLAIVLILGLRRVVSLGLLLVLIDSYLKYVNKLEADYERKCLDAFREASSRQNGNSFWNYCLSFYGGDADQCPLNRTLLFEHHHQPGFHHVTGKLEIMIKFILDHLWMIVDEVIMKVFSLFEKIVVGGETYTNWFQWAMMQFRSTVHDNLLKPVVALLVVFTILLLIIFKALNLGRFFTRILVIFLSSCGLWSIAAASKEVFDHDDETLQINKQSNEAIKISSETEIVCRHCNGSGKLSVLRPQITKVYYVNTKTVPNLGVIVKPKMTKRHD